ncbi:MAG: PAS domain S-box protein [Pseudomonadota bacterium]
MKDKSKYPTKDQPKKIIWIGIAAAAFSWVFESAIHTFALNQRGFLEHLFFPGFHEAWMRMAIAGVFVTFSFYAQRLITERIRAAKMSELCSDELEQIFQTAGDGMRVIGKDFTILRMSEPLSRLTGVDVKNAIGRKCYDAFRGDFCNTPQCCMARILAGEERLECEAQKDKKDGTKLHCAITATTLRDCEGKLVGIVENFKDITRLKQAEEKCRSSEQELSVIFNTVANPILSILPNGIIENCNKSVIPILGYNKEDLIGMSLERLLRLPDSKEQSEVVRRILSEVSLRGMECKMAKKDGTLIDVKIDAAKVTGGWCDCIICLIEDITISKRIEEELLNVRKLESIATLAGGIAHDFNNALTAIMGGIELVKIMIPSEKKALSILEKTDGALARAKALAAQLLTFSSGGHPVTQTTSIASLLTETAQLALRGFSLGCEHSISEDLWSVDIDIGQMRQVITDLLLNARDAMPSGGIVRICAENLMTDEDDKYGFSLKGKRYIKISITDHGAGIAPEHIKKIFDPFFSTRQQKSGLGLATAYSIIKKHKGYITLESEPDSGTTFYIYLPASEKEPLQAARPELKKSDIKGKKHILLMDDEEIVRDVAGEMLLHLGHIVEFAKEGSEAVELYKTAKESGYPFDLVIMDLTVKNGMDGKEAMKKIIEIDPNAKAIVSSGYSNDPIMAEHKKYGFSAVIPKPYTINQLQEALERI